MTVPSPLILPSPLLLQVVQEEMEEEMEEEMGSTRRGVAQDSCLPDEDPSALPRKSVNRARGDSGEKTVERKSERQSVT